MVKDSFFLDGTIKVDIEISINDASIDIKVVIENTSDSRIMLFNKYFMFDRYFYFVNEHDQKGDAYYKIYIEYDWDVNIESIDIINPGSIIQYSTHQNCKRNDTTFVIFSDERSIEFDNPALVKIVLKYYRSANEMKKMREIVTNANFFPTFTKSYTIKEFQ